MTQTSPGKDFADRSEQQLVVQRHRALRAEYNRALDEHAAALAIPIEIGIDATSSAFVDTEAYRRAREAVAALGVLEAEYFRRLPRLALSRCPLCDKALFRSFDAFALPGPSSHSLIQATMAILPWRPASSSRMAKRAA